MYIFIDESGVHKSIDHSCLALVYIAVQDYKVLEDSVIKIEEKLGLGPFHWANTVWRVKKQFMDEVLKLDFRVKAAVIKNPAFLDKEMENILSRMIIEKDVTIIYIDGRKPKWYEHRIKKVLRDKGVGARKLRTVNDSQFAGVRVADMVAGLVRSIADGKHAEELMPYFNKLKRKSLFLINI